ncbi:MAG: LPS assembly protein LptD [Desulfuromonadales bacterium]|nr:LPS assembly protein LptD [Desulfuromonadales bacterium]
MNFSRYIILYLILFLPVTATAVEIPKIVPNNSEVKIEADSITHDQNDNTIRAIGNVRIDWNDAILYADHVSYNQDSGEMKATDNIKLIKGNDWLRGDKAMLNSESVTGKIINGWLFFKESNMHIRGGEIAKTGDKEYRVQNGSFTSCDADVPSWKFSADDISLSLDNYIKGRNVLLYIKNIPVLWLPYFIFPAKTERQSGFLFPTFGNSSLKGVFLNIPYYFALSPSQELTADLDLQSKRGAGIGLDYNYMGRNKGFGRAKGYLIYDTSKSKFRGNIVLQQQTNFTPNLYWRANVDMASDRTFYKDFGDINGDYNRQYTEGTAFLSYKRNTLLFTGLLDYMDNLDAPSNGGTAQKLPSLSIIDSSRRLGSTPLYFSMQSGITNFYRDEGSKGMRLAVAPRLTFQKQIMPGISAKAWGEYNQQLYYATNPPENYNSTNMGVTNAGVSIKGELGRTFDRSLFGNEKLYHQFIPELSYHYSGHYSDGSTPSFDYDDQPLNGQIIQLALRNILTGKHVSKDTTNYRTLLKFDIIQGYQISGSRRNLLVTVDQGRKFTDTRLNMEVTPLEKLRFTADAWISPYSGSLTNGSFGVTVGNPKENRVRLEYHRAQGSLIQGTINSEGTIISQGSLNYIEGEINVTRFKPFTFSALGRYSNERHGFLETLYSVEYKHQCWSITFTYRNRPVEGDNEFTVTFNLFGLGSPGPMKVF